MSSSAQAAANAANAQHSTGPRTEAGKARSSKNSVVFGLFSGDFVRAGEEDAFASLQTELFNDLAPRGAMEEILAQEIVHAAWRLRRCALVESHIFILTREPDRPYTPDPMECIERNIGPNIQKSVDRARSLAHRLFHKSHAELRKLQAERRTAAATPRETESSPMESAAQPEESELTKQTRSASPCTPRNAQCPCRSGRKFKRCCGKTAPPTLEKAA